MKNELMIWVLILGIFGAVKAFALPPNLAQAFTGIAADMVVLATMRLVIHVMLLAHKQIRKAASYDNKHF